MQNAGNETTKICYSGDVHTINRIECQSDLARRLTQSRKAYIKFFASLYASLACRNFKLIIEIGCPQTTLQAAFRFCPSLPQHSPVGRHSAIWDIRRAKRI
jgi:hypothetical protein